MLDAKKALQEKVQSARDLMEKLEIELQRVEKLEAPHWGHVGDLTYVLEQLENAYHNTRQLKMEVAE